MKSLDEYLPAVRPYAPGCPDPTAYFAVRQAAIEFCERTRMWHMDDKWNVTPSDCEMLVTPAGSMIHEIEKVWFDGVELEKVTPGQLDDLVWNWRNGTDKPIGTPRYVTQQAQNTMTLVPYGTGAVQVSIFLKPSQDCEYMPDFIVDQHRETIAYGALARILRIPNQSFTDIQAALMYGQLFSEKLDSRASKGITGQHRAPVRSTARFI